MSIDKNMKEVFDLPEEAVSYSRQTVLTKEDKVVPPEDAKLEHDFATARENVHTLLNMGSDALEEALELARQSENPRAFEVYSEMLKTMLEGNLRLLELNEKYKKLLPQKAQEDAKQVTNNTAVFVGTTAELNKMIEKMTKGS